MTFLNSTKTLIIYFFSEIENHVLGFIIFVVLQLRNTYHNKPRGNILSWLLAFGIGYQFTVSAFSIVANISSLALMGIHKLCRTGQHGQYTWSLVFSPNPYVNQGKFQVLPADQENNLTIIYFPNLSFLLLKICNLIPSFLF